MSLQYNTKIILQYKLKQEGIAEFFHYISYKVLRFREIFLVLVFNFTYQTPFFF